jgi:hypothetical protein
MFDESGRVSTLTGGGIDVNLRCCAIGAQEIDAQSRSRNRRLCAPLTALKSVAIAVVSRDDTAPSGTEKSRIVPFTTGLPLDPLALSPSLL